MCRSFRWTLAALALVGASSALAQDPIQDFMTGRDPLSMQMRQMEANIIQQNLNNPQVQQMYRQHLAQGGRMSPQQFAYEYGRQGGLTPQGRANAAAAQAQINANNAAANAAYRNHQQQLQQQRQQDYNAFHNRQTAAGNTMMGVTTYYNPQDGRCYNAAYVQAGVPYSGQVACPR
jgi:hypothetical protein